MRGAALQGFTGVDSGGREREGERERVRYIEGYI